MTTTTPTPAGRDTRAPASGTAPTGNRRVPFAVVAVASVLGGLVTTLVLVLVVFAGATEPVITGAGLLGLASGWALLAVLTTRWTDQPQRWAAVPAAAMALTGAGLLAVTPGDGALTAAGWVWPAVALALAGWMVRAARRATTGRSRWLLYPAIGLVAVTAVAGAGESISLARDHGRYPMPGALHDVGGHRLHLNCTGTGSPTVVLENGMNEISPLWSAITARIARTTRVCAYDRAGQAWSEDADAPQDGIAVATDLHTLLSRAGESGPYVLAGHSIGGTLAMTYAARYPAQVAGLVLLDSSSPHQFTDQPDFPGTYAMMRRLLPVLPALARVGAFHLAPPPASTALTPSAAAQVRWFATSPRGMRNMRDEQSQLRQVFGQAQALTSFDPKPLAVVTASENADGTKGWAAAQDRLATLSSNSSHTVVDTTHVGLLDDAAASTESVRAITSVVTAVRTGTPLATR
ncbi:MAG TPA: alpha/beta hydrolase [Pseudonocardia sp.]|nr:alpha/beta hydrolase [Pseudonocardia sp.]